MALGDFLGASEYVKIQPSIRASIAGSKEARALAFLDGRDYVVPDDVKFLAPFTMRHRIFLKPEALAEDVNADRLISNMVQKVPVPSNRG